MKRTISNHTLKTLVKTTKHFFPNFLDLIKQLTDPRKARIKYPLENIILIELLNFLTAGKSQRHVESAFNEENFLRNISKITGKQINEIFDSEIFTDVFSRMSAKEFEDLKYRLVNRLIRNKVFDSEKTLRCFNVVLDMTRFQKAHYEVHPEMLHQTNEGITTWYQSVEELKIIGNGMAISMCNEMVRNTDSEEKQDCEINAMKRLLPKLHRYFPRLKLRILGDGLYSCNMFFNLCKKYNWEYITVLPDERIPSVMEEYELLVGMEKGNILFEEDKKHIKIVQWVNKIPYKEHMLNVLEQITYNKKTKEQTR